MLKTVPSAIKIMILFILLVASFFVVFMMKKNSPINRPDNVAGIVQNAWYDNHTTTSKANTEEWTLDPRIPANYVPVPGEDGVYMVIDDSGLVIKYMKAEFQEDGSIIWSETQLEGATVYEPVEGLDNVYKYTDENGDEAFLKYIRNEDNTFAYVDVDQFGMPFTHGMDASTIGENFRYTGEDNIYELLNKDGVVTGFYERFQNNDGSYQWMLSSMPTPTPAKIGNSQGYHTRTVNYFPVDNMNNGQGRSGNANYQNQYYEYTQQGKRNLYFLDPFNSGVETTTNDDGTKTVVESKITSEVIDGVTYTYQTDITSTYLADGTLYKTSSEGPYLISQTEAETQAAASMIENSLSGEYARVSAYVNYDTYTASELLSYLNARRNMEGKSTLSMDMSSDLYKIACIRAADMAMYNDVSNTSPTYGSIADLCRRYNVNVTPLENVLGTSNQTGEEINLTFQANESSRNVRMSDVSQCAIVIANYNGQQYVVELFAN